MNWLFAELPHSTKQLVKASIYKNAIYRVLREYEKGGPGSWAKRETNWNVVCNTGMVLGALAVAEDYPEEAETILENAAKYMPNCLKLFAPDGVCYEGPAYWGYTNRYLSMYLKAVTDNGGDKGNRVELLNAQSKVSWVACTKAQVKVKGNKSHLMRDGKHFYMKIVAPANAAFKTYPAQNTHKGEKPIEGITMLEAECVFPSVNGNIVVRMSSKPL